MKRSGFIALLLGVSLFFAGHARADEVASEKINQVLENQKQILASLDDIKKELEIVKVRASQH